ncbi:MAG: YraN family protein [Spirochaetales bacterium]|nr:YraN family protein [Spirochaetales bacterium]
MTTTEKGRAGEVAAREYLESCGYRVLEKNYRRFGAEIDLIVCLESTIVFVEVKNWGSFGYEEMERALNRSKRNKILAASKGFLSESAVFDRYKVRYDLIHMNGKGKNLRHIENAFTETGTV